jgi:ligand-binding sensor domain-containing protein
MKQICLIILFLFKITYVLTAQSYSEFKKIEGPYSNVVYSIMQDTKGFIWIATEAGVIRYDGNKLINFTVDEGLTSNDVFQIFEDKKNRIWFLTYDGKPCFYLNGKISNGINTNWLRRISPKKFATYFHQIDENEFWYVTLDSAYHFINDKLVNNIGRYNQDAFNNIQAVHKYKDSTYIIENMGVYNTTSKKMNLFKNDFIIYPNYTKVYCYEDKIFYFISNKLICYSITSRSSKLIYQTRITNNHLVFIPTRKKHEVICSLKDSLYTLDMTKEEVKDFKYLNINYISNYLKDFENNIWISSLESGLLISYKQQDKNIHKISIPKAEQNYYATTINKLDNKIYIGVEGGKYVLINGSKNELKRVSSKANSNSKVLQFFSFNNNLFILSENRLIIKKRLKGEISEIEYPFKQAVEVKDYLYFVTSLGIYRIAKKNVEGLTNLNFIKLFERINTERFSCILALSEDSLLVGGTRGLQLLKNDKIDSSFLSSFEIKKGFISKIIKHKNGDIIFATRNFGIGIINNKNIFTINKSDGLLSNNCNSLYVSENGDLWVATAKGINKIKYIIRPNQKIRTYIEAVLSKHTESTGYINDLAIYSDSLIFATRTGAFIHSLSKKITQTYTPPYSY